MGDNEFDCAADLLGRAVSVARRVSGLNCEIEGICTGVVSSVPGDGCMGVIEVEGLDWNGDGVTRYRFDLSVWMVENCRTLTKEDRKLRDAAKMTADPEFTAVYASLKHAALEQRS